jgi:hypothetical protein
MSLAASTYRALGMNADALVAGERALEIFLRVLPEKHPAIGEGHVQTYVLHVLC